ncbi:MAG: autotransporter domain-containing protein [Pseudomonadota bacterium]|nr:autotransporter domain-containing protein [Pseudomonadota bacterium]
MAVALALAAAPTLAQESPFSQTVFFGDSLTDSGHFRPVLIQVVGPNGALIGKFTTNPGLVWSEYLADHYGTDATSDNQGGSNYAVGGAWVGTETAGGLGAQPSLATQVGGYLASTGGRADPNALYSVWGGANDLFSVTSLAQAPAVIGAAVAAEVGIVGGLKAAGARYVLVANVPDLGLTPAFRAGGAPMMAQGTALASAYNDALFAGLASQGLSVIPVDTFGFLQEVAADPGAYGFSNVTSAGCSTAVQGGSSLFCSPASYVSPDVPGGYMFADGVHPTTRTHAMMAELAVSMIDGPRQVAMLPHVETVVGRARAERVATRTSQPRDGAQADGMQWWFDVRADSQRYGDGNDYDGIGPALTIGVEKASGNLVYGGFAGYGQQAMDWGLRRGSFDQNDATIGGYAGWRSGSLWLNGQASYSQLGYDIDREVQLGPVTRVHSGSPDGSNISIGVGAGWDFGEGALRHGPVVSLLSQKIEIDGYAESDAALSTALAYPEQSFDSLIASVGWQLDWAPSDRIHPYARVTVDREYQEAPEQAFASAQSIPGSLQYAVPGLGFDDQYGTLMFGARTHLFGMEANVGASATFGQSLGNDASVFATFGNRF